MRNAPSRRSPRRRSRRLGRRTPGLEPGCLLHRRRIAPGHDHVPAALHRLPSGSPALQARPGLERRVRRPQPQPRLARALQQLREAAAALFGNGRDSTSSNARQSISLRCPSKKRPSWIARYWSLAPNSPPLPSRRRRASSPSADSGTAATVARAAAGRSRRCGQSPTARQRASRRRALVEPLARDHRVGDAVHGGGFRRDLAARVLRGRRRPRRCAAPCRRARHI